VPPQVTVQPELPVVEVEDEEEVVVGLVVGAEEVDVVEEVDVEEEDVVEDPPAEPLVAPNKFKFTMPDARRVFGLFAAIE